MPERRRQCAFCRLASRWPDHCDRGREPCHEVIPLRCEQGDHRRCDAPHCEVAERWHDAVRDAATDLTRQADTRYAVVSIIGDELTVIGAEDHLGRAKSLLRSGEAKRHGYSAYDPASKGLVYVVTRDGWFL